MSQELRQAAYELLVVQEQMMDKMTMEDPARVALAGWQVLRTKMDKVHLALQADLESDTATRGRKGDPATSTQAIDLARVRAGTHKYLLAEVYFNHSQGLTAEEAVEMAGLSGRSSPWHRVSDLKLSGLLVYTGETRLTRSGADAEILAMTAEAKATWMRRHPGTFPSHPTYQQEAISYE